MALRTGKEKKEHSRKLLIEKYSKMVEFFEQKRAEGYGISDATLMTADKFVCSTVTVYNARKCINDERNS